MGVLHERPEVRLVVAPGHLLAQRHAFDRERGLRGEHLESPAEGEQNRLGGSDDEEPHRRPGCGSVGRHERARPTRSRSRPSRGPRRHRGRPRAGAGSAPPGCPHRARAHLPWRRRRATPPDVSHPGEPGSRPLVRTDVARSAASSAETRSAPAVRSVRSRSTACRCRATTPDSRTRTIRNSRAEDAAIIGRAPNLAGERLGEERAGRDERHRHQQRDAPMLISADGARTGTVRSAIDGRSAARPQAM